MPTKVELGTVIRGFGYGYFGRDNYADKHCIHVGFYDGKRYAVFHSEAGPGDRFDVIAGDALRGLEDSIDTGW